MPKGAPRVLVFNHFAAPRGAAGGTRHVELFSRLDGWEYLIIASDLNPQTGQRVACEPGLAVVRVPSYSSNGVRRVANWIAYAWGAVILGLRQRHVDVVYASSPHLLAGLAGWIVATVKRVPFVLEVRDLWPQILSEMGSLRVSSPIYRVLTRIELFLYRRARAIVTMAVGTRSSLVSRGVRPQKLHFIPNGADQNDFVPTADRQRLRDKYGFSKCTAIYTGAHGPANGLDLLLDAANFARELDLEIVLVGGGIEKDGLVARARKEGLSNIRFMDAVPKIEIPDLLAAADFGLHVLADVPLFRSSISPNKVYDYMAAALPVLTNSPGLVGQLVEEAQCGRAVEPQDLVRGLEQMRLDAEAGRLAVMGERGRDWISENQSRRLMAQRLQSALSDVLRADD